MVIINLIYIIMAIVSIYVYVVAIANHSSRISNIFILFMLVQVIINLSVLILIPIESATLTQWYLAYKLKNLVLIFQPIIWLLFMYEYLRIKYNKKLVILYCAFGGVIFIKTIASSLNMFIDTMFIRILSHNAFGAFNIYKFITMVYILFSIYIFIHVLVVYVIHTKDEKALFKYEIIGLTLCMISTIIAQIYIQKQVTYSLDLTAIFSIISIILFLKLITKNSILDTIPISNSKIIDTLPSPILIMNVKDKIIYANKKAYETIQKLDVGVNITDIPSVVEYNIEDDVLENKSIVIKDLETKVKYTYLVNIEEYDEKYKYVIFQDATDIKDKMIQLHRKSMIDGLTGLLNKVTFYEKIGAEIKKELKEKEYRVMIMTDLDFFKKVNDSYGHKVGDEAIVTLAICMKAVLGGNFIIARFGGDEFCGFCTTNDIKETYLKLEKLCNIFAEQPFQVKNEQFTVTISVGVVFIDEDVKNVDELINKADLALYKAKRTGRDKVVVFMESMDR